MTRSLSLQYIVDWFTPGRDTISLNTTSLRTLLVESFY